MQFTPLHIHSDYSILQSTANISNIIAKAKEFNYKSLALTDTMSLSGAHEFYSLCKEGGIEPIIGINCVIISPVQNGKYNFYELLLLAKNKKGYINLCNICDKGSLRSYEMSHIRTEYDSYVTFEEVVSCSSDLVAISNFNKGEFVQLLASKNEESFKEKLDVYRKHFSDFFIEIEKHPGQNKLANELIKKSKSYHFKLVASNSVYYINEDDAEAHHLHVCIGEKSILSDTQKNIRFGSSSHYLKSPQQMYELFVEHPEYILETENISQLCEFEFWKDENHYPIYEDVEEGVSQEEYLKKICYERISFRYPNIKEKDKKALIERIEFELNTINKSGYASYFLVVWDFIQYAYKNNIPVGPGRGSGAGSVIAYLLEITDLDPILYDLLFERFLNPERISPPDFDIDFCEKKRSDVIDYVVKKYGKEKVVQIGTFGKLKAKAVVKDVNRVLGQEVKTGDNLSNMLIEGKSLKFSLENSNEFKAEYELDSQVKRTVDYATKLEGLTRQRGIHAAGVIIGDKAITNYTAVFRGKKGEVITQFDGPTCEELGLLKMDFLGLRTLTIIQEAVELIEQNHQEKINFRNMKPDDKATYEIFQQGVTTAIFQFESPGMRKHLINLQPTEFEDLIAMNALYRPGPMEYIGDFIQCKKNPKKIVYDLPELEEILSPTYGVTVYQEQVMLLSQKLAGFSKGEADNLRKAMGKKQKDKLDKMRPQFIKGAIAKGHPKNVLEKIWSDWEAFTQYAFNKSHSTAYAWIAYQTAYLKKHYPLEFFTAFLNATSDISAMGNIFDDCLQLGVKILIPNINKSKVKFSTEEGCIRFGLSYIKGSGEGVAEAIMKEREANGDFQDFSEFCKRVIGEVGYSNILIMITAGAMDDFGHSRASLAEIAEIIVERAKEDKIQEDAGQASLFSLLGDTNQDNSLKIDIPNIPEWNNELFFEKEKNVLGAYLSGHPLDIYQESLKELISHNLAAINIIEKKQPAKQSIETFFTALVRVRKN